MTGSGQARTTTTRGTDEAARPPRSLRPPLEVLDIGAEGVGLLAEHQWTDGDRNSKTLLKTESLRIVLTALRAGGTLSNDDPDEAVALQGLQGEVSVAVEDEAVTLRTGQLVCLAGGDPWRVTATADSLFVLFVGRSRFSAE